VNAAFPARLVFAGLMSTVIVTFIAYLGPLLGFPLIDLAACFAAVFIGTTLEGSREWWGGLTLFFGLGVFVLPAIYRFGFQRILAVQDELAGLALGFLVYLGFSGLILPLAGQGVFGWNTPDPLLLNTAGIFMGAAYGLALSRIASPPEADVLPVASESSRAA
jgi:hypothetical protein